MGLFGYFLGGIEIRYGFLVIIYVSNIIRDICRFILYYYYLVFFGKYFILAVSIF